MPKKKLMKSHSIEETMKFIYDEADHIIGTTKGFHPTTLGLKMIRADAKAIQTYAKQVMDQLAKISRNRRELFIDCCKVLEGGPSERK